MAELARIERSWRLGRSLPLALLASVGMLGAVLAVPCRAEDDEAVARGRALAQEKCARCHALDLEDKSPHEKAPPFRDVVEIYPSEHLSEALAEGIVSGHPDMPVFVLEPLEIEGFLAYLNSLAERRGVAPKGSDTPPESE